MSDQGVPAAPAVPVFSTIPVFAKMTGLSRSAIYRELASGNLRARKFNKRVLIDVQHGLLWIGSLPLAQIGAEKVEEIVT